MIRLDKRKPEELRPIRITPNYLKHPEGSVLIEIGETKVICTASIQNSVPPFLKGTGKGWVTAEYAMLPRSTTERTQRETTKVRGRTHEIQRLIGRSLRAVVNMSLLGERQITIDCDVIQADGGTRTASITGGYVALVLAVKKLQATRVFPQNPVKGQVAAVSVGILNGTPILDLNYDEDSRAEVDMNVVMTSDDRYVELQGTAEQSPFSDKELEAMKDLARSGIAQLLEAQRKVIP